MENPQSFVTSKDQIEAGMFTDSKLRFVVDKTKTVLTIDIQRHLLRSLFQHLGNRQKDRSDVMKEVMDKVQVLDIAMDQVYKKTELFLFSNNRH